VWSIDAAWDLYAMSEYSTITSLSESPLVAGLLYAGTDDGRIQVSEDGGANWRAVERLPDVTDDFFVNDIKADLHDADTVYVTLDDHKSGDFTPYVYRSTDRGRNWTSLRGDLEDRNLVWRIVQDHVKPELLFLGTESGVFFTVDAGQHWIKLAGGMPTISLRDLEIQTRENDLVAASFGRGFFILDDYTSLRELSDEALQQPVLLFPVRDAWWYLPKLPLGDFTEGGKSQQGDGYFIAPNPPFGAVFTYYLKEDLLSQAEARRKAEKKQAEAGEDTPTPGWDAVRAEELEEATEVILTVTDSDGAIVRQVSGPTKAGFHRVAWDLRYPLSSPWTPEPAGESYLVIPGPLAAPGTYQVTLSQRHNGELQALGEPQSFEVKPMRERGLKGASMEEVVSFTRQLDDLNRRVTGAESAIAALLVETGAMKSALLRSSAAEALRASVRTLELELLQMQENLAGNARRSLYNHPERVSINRRLEVASLGTFRSTYGPTATHQQALQIASG
ncbi:MAG TPA: hypothetical protein VJN01_04970, partial [Xanthomonadales bacterium]|nr:hypothetical protein [Xanthomonadales bacterium]